MDPNAALARLRRLAIRLIADEDDRSRSHEQTTRDTQGSEMAQVFQDLDQWIVRGGFLPRDWDRTGES